MFFTILGWLVGLFFALGFVLVLPPFLVGLSQFGGGSGRYVWAIPLLVGCVLLYLLFTHAPFHIVLS